MKQQMRTPESISIGVSKWIFIVVTWWLLGFLAQPLAAGEGEKPFAEAHVVLQLSDGEPERQARVLSVANNLIKHYGGPDFIDIEIVAFGPGIALLFAENKNLERISSLAANGVRFVGCMNTVDTIERKTGERPQLNPVTIPVQTGVAHLIDRSNQDYVIIQP
jgi:intracellular sulfur oxidation DsrE/DsrF family protein